MNHLHIQFGLILSYNLINGCCTKYYTYLSMDGLLNYELYLINVIFYDIKFLDELDNLNGLHQVYVEGL